MKRRHITVFTCIAAIVLALALLPLATFAKGGTIEGQGYIGHPPSSTTESSSNSISTSSSGPGTSAPGASSSSTGASSAGVSSNEISSTTAVSSGTVSSGVVSSDLTSSVEDVSGSIASSTAGRPSSSTALITTDAGAVPSRSKPSGGGAPPPSGASSPQSSSGASSLQSSAVSSSRRALRTTPANDAAPTGGNSQGEGAPGGGDVAVSGSQGGTTMAWAPVEQRKSSTELDMTEVPLGQLWLQQYWGLADLVTSLLILLAGMVLFVHNLRTKGSRWTYLVCTLCTLPSILFVWLETFNVMRLFSVWTPIFALILPGYAALVALATRGSRKKGGHGP